MSLRQRFATLLIAVALVALPLVLPPRAQRQSFGFAWTGVCVGSSDPDSTAADVATIQGLECLIANILTVFIALIGMAAFVMVLIAGFRYLVSGGNTKGPSKRAVR